MKRKNQTIKKMTAFLCACFMLLGCLSSVPYYAIDNDWYIPQGMPLIKGCIGNGKIPHEDKIIDEYVCDIPYDYLESYGSFYVLMGSLYNSSKFYLAIANVPISINLSSGCYLGFDNDTYQYLTPIGAEDVIMRLFVTTDNGLNWSLAWGCDWVNGSGYFAGDYNSPTKYGITDVSRNDYEWWYGLCETNHYVVAGSDGGVSSNAYKYLWSPTVNFDGSPLGSGKYNSELGYIQNVTRKSTYIRDALYNYDEDSLTIHWKHDLLSSTGVDFSGGDYKIRHYISMATVTGYEKDDIVEMSDKYLVGEYDASDGGFSYLEKDYDDKIAALGYENIGWFDSIFKGYFVLEHNYFQIVNSATNEVGGYLHFYPKDSDGDSFGVEYEYEGLDNDFVVDENAPSGFIDNQTGSGLTHEDALENAEQPKLDDLDGVDELTANLDAYASQIGGVTNGIGALFGQLPPWIVGLLGLSVALSFAVVVFKVLRG